LSAVYPRVYAPVLRGPLLFHHHTGVYCPPYNPPQPRPVQSRAVQATNPLYFPRPTSPYAPQYRYTHAQATLANRSQSYPYYSTMPRPIVPSQAPFSSYSMPPVTYASTVSSKGLALILIATLMLVALDLVIVRPQKR